MAGPRITVDEWQAELERVMGRSDDKGLTMRELAEKFGVSTRSMRERLGALHRAGRVGQGWRGDMTIDGKPKRVPVYWLKK